MSAAVLTSAESAIAELALVFLLWSRSFLSRRVCRRTSCRSHFEVLRPETGIRIPLSLSQERLLDKKQGQRTRLRYCSVCEFTPVLKTRRRQEFGLKSDHSLSGGIIASRVSKTQEGPATGGPRGRTICSDSRGG